MICTSKPCYGTPLNRPSSLLNGLVWFAPCWEGAGTAINDVIGGVNLATTGSPTWAGGGSPLVGSGLNIATSSQFAYAAAPATLQLAGSMSLVWGFRVIAAPVAINRTFGLYINAGASVYGFCFRINTTPQISVQYTPTGTANANGNSLNLTVGQDYIAIANIARLGSGAGSVTLALFNPQTGAASSASNISLSFSSATYTTPQIAFSPSAATPTNSVRHYFGALYNRVLSSGEIAAWGTNPWQLFSSARMTILPFPTVATPAAPCLMAAM